MTERGPYEAHVRDAPKYRDVSPSVLLISFQFLCRASRNLLAISTMRSMTRKLSSTAVTRPVLEPLHALGTAFSSQNRLLIFRKANGTVHSLFKKNVPFITHYC